MEWSQQISAYKNYLKLEKSLSDNSVDAYVHDVQKLADYLKANDGAADPSTVSADNIREFLEFLHSISLAAHSQARILSGLKSFFTFLMNEGAMKDNPTKMVESPKLGRKLPDTLSINEIEKDSGKY